MPFGKEPFEVDDAARRQGLVRDLSVRQSRGSEDPGFFGTVAKIGTLIGVGALLGRTIPRDRLIGALDLLGQHGKAVTSPAGSFIRGFMDELAGARSGPRAAIRNFDLLEHVADSLSVYRQAQAAGKTPAELQALVRATQEGLRRRGFEDLNRHGMERLRAATVGDIFNSTVLENAIGGRSSNTFKVISEARNLGMIGENVRLTRGRVGGLFVRGDGIPAATAQIVDTRFVSPRNIMSSLYNVARNIRVPYTGFRPADLIAAVVRPFGEGRFAGRVGSGLEVAEGVKTGSRLNFVIGGQLLRESTSGAFDIVDAGLRLGQSGKVGQAHLERYGAAEKQFAARFRGLNREGLAGKLTEAEEVLGIGPDLRQRDPFFKTMVLDPIKRRSEGVLQAKSYVRRGDTMSFMDRYRLQVQAERQGLDFESLLNEAVINPKKPSEFSFFDKLKAYLDVDSPGIVVKPRAAAPYTERDLPVRSTEYSGRLTGRRSPVASLGDRASPNKLGEIGGPPTVPIEFYAYRGKGVSGIAGSPGEWMAGQTEALLDVLHYGTNRLNDLLGATIGVGFRPSVGKGIAGGFIGLGKNIAKLYGIQYGVEAGMEYLDYADYLSEMAIKPVVTGFGAFDHPYTSIKKMGIGLYQAAQLARTGLRDIAGIDNLARYSEELMPGSMDTGASFLARTVVPVVAGLAKGGIPGLKAGLGIAALVGGTEPGKTFDEQLAEFTGDKEVAVRKSRWWALGRQPFEGGQIDYFTPHWTRRALSDYRFTDVQYGSKGEYFSSVSRIPTPHNLFGLVPLLQEGGPISGGDYHLAKKHRLTRPYPDSPGVDYDEAKMMAQHIAAQGPYDAPMGAGQRLGYGTAGTMAAPVQEGGLLNSLKEAGGELAELSGIYKFMFYDLWGGGEGAPPKLASYETIGSKSREFWDSNLGGMLGMTEIYRRFRPQEEGRQGINPVPNLMPSWLPGIRSDSVRDQQYHIDFTLGDAYAKIAQGEHRLPGAGYEALHRLHSGTPGVYDAMDRFLILADVAPNSDLYKQYRQIVEGWASAGILDRHWSTKFNATKKQVSEKLERYKFYDRKFTGLITDPNPEQTADKYNLIEKAIGGTWEFLSHDVVPRAGKLVPFGDAAVDKLFPVFSPIEHYKRFQVYGEEFADWRSPWKAFLRPKLDSMEADNPLAASAAGASFALFGSNPIAALALGITGGLTGGALSTARAIETGNWEGGSVPTHRNEQWDLEQYFDNIQYAKGRMLEQRAIAMNDEELAYHYKQMWTRTAAAIDYNAPRKDYMRQAIRGLSKEQRAYFKSFANMSSEAQEEMLNYMPEHVKPIMIGGADRMDEAKFANYRHMTRASADSRVASYFQSIGGMPSSDWGGWHPDVPMDAIKIKMVDAGWGSTSADIHKFSLFNEHRYRASKFDNLDIPEPRDLSHVDRHSSDHSSLIAELQSAGFQNVRLRPGLGGAMDNIQWNMRRSTWEQVRDAIGEVLR